MKPSTFAKAPSLEIDDILGNLDLHIIVCTGAGGVEDHDRGRARPSGPRRWAVMSASLTIDLRGKRLARAMGLSSLDNTPRQVPGCARPAAPARCSR